MAVAVVTSISYQAAWKGNMFWVIVFESKNLFYIIVIIINFFSFSFFNKIFLLKINCRKMNKDFESRVCENFSSDVRGLYI